ncbi:hypothetical protein D3C72_434460 [compost metagenome]
MAQQNTTVSGGIGFFGLLTIVFVALKLTKVITWSWFWVLSPSLIPLMLTIVVILFMLLGAWYTTRKLKKRFHKKF